MKDGECHLSSERQYRSRHIRSKKEESMSKDRKSLVWLGKTRRSGSKSGKVGRCQTMVAKETE